MRALFTFILLTLPASGAQQVSAPGQTNVHVHVIDSVSGRPVSRVGVQAEGWAGIAWTDSSGNFKMRRVPVVSELRVRCPTSRRFAGRIVRRQRLVLSAERDTQIVIRLPVTECAEPPIRTISGEFSGHYTTGYESSDFRPCNGLPVEGKVYGDSLDDAWVEFSSRVDVMKMKWPKFPDTVSYPTVYARWVGTLTGPGAYGHLGVSTYQLLVDRILEIRKPKRGDCDRARAP
jgi:hypothetical protein